MQPQEYTIIHLDPGKEPYFDQNKNQWVNVLFDEAKNEPIKWVVKDLAAYQLGQKVYGHIEVKTSQAGKPYNRFYRDQKPDDSYSNAPTQTGQVAQAKYPPRNDDTQESIARSVALKASVDFHSHSATTPPEDIVLASADRFLAWLQGNSGSQGSSISQTASTVPTNTAEIPQPAAPKSSRPWEKVGQSREDDALDAEAEALYKRGAEAEYIPDDEPPWER